ncbi:MAG: DoxX family protein [Thermoleophilaceae bacterium]|nr:DoxX family protein [Thermoleophilaceae bacterium]
MDLIFLLGRILFAALFIGSGIGHLTDGENTKAYAKAAGAPARETTVPLTGVMLLVGGLSVLFGVFSDAGALLLFAFLGPAAFLMHAFWKVEEPGIRQIEMAQFMKNISLSGACLIIFWLYSEGEDLPLSLTDSLF